MITSEYKKQLEQMANRHVFKEKIFFYNDIKDYVEKEKPTSLLDFGCAHGRLIELLKEDFPNISTMDGYDPGVPQFERLPNRSYDCLISNDVIEHIEPAYLDSTLEKIDSYFERSAWIIIACYPAKKFLPDGRNAHLTVQHPNWWIDKIQQVMKRSTIRESSVIVKNPDSDVISRKTKQVLIPKGQQLELRMILEK